jgi:cellulose synthase (UDP-forming)
MNTNQKIIYSILNTLALFATLAFGIYWFQLNHIANNFNGWASIFDVLLFLITTYIIWLPIFMKGLLWSIASHIKPMKTKRPQPGLRVALITTFVPASESISLLHQTLPAMVKVEYPHDTWLLDEGNDPEVKKICDMYGVNHFSRSGKNHYNMHSGKFARKTKGGNHNSWYDTAGNNYDIVAQMDTDFIPNKKFLVKTLGFFQDPKVAFVGTPQVYGNTSESLIAKGAAEQTFSFYGPVLRGMSGMESSLLIGANHVIRVSALKAVDHYSAHITEDLLTGMKLHANGWKSVYVPEALAIGEGPTTWKAYFDQQKRWAYGCMHILFSHSFGLFKYMSLRRVLYYYSIQQHYFTGVAMLLGVLCLGLYFVTGIASADLLLVEFLPAYLGMIFILTFMDLWLQRFNVRPRQERGIMWAGMYIAVAVWPVFLMAFFELFKRKKLVYKVTPKGRKAKNQNVAYKLFAPHMIVGMLMLAGFASSFYTGRMAPIMLFWALITGVGLVMVPFIPSIITFIKSSSKKLRKANREFFANSKRIFLDINAKY